MPIFTETVGETPSAGFVAETVPNPAPANAIRAAGQFGLAAYEGKQLADFMNRELVVSPGEEGVPQIDVGLNRVRRMVEQGRITPEQGDILIEKSARNAIDRWPGIAPEIRSRVSSFRSSIGGGRGEDGRARTYYTRAR